MNIKKSQYDMDLHLAHQRGYDEGRARVSEYARLANDWRNRFEQLKADGPDIRNELEGAIQRGQRIAMTRVRGQLIEALNKIGDSE